MASALDGVVQDLREFYPTMVGLRPAHGDGAPAAGVSETRAADVCEAPQPPTASAEGSSAPARRALDRETNLAIEEIERQIHEQQQLFEGARSASNTSVTQDLSELMEVVFGTLGVIKEAIVPESPTRGRGGDAGEDGAARGSDQDGAQRVSDALNYLEKVLLWQVDFEGAGKIPSAFEPIAHLAQRSIDSVSYSVVSGCSCSVVSHSNSGSYVML